MHQKRNDLGTSKYCRWGEARLKRRAWQKNGGRRREKSRIKEEYHERENEEGVRENEKRKSSGWRRVIERILTIPTGEINKRINGNYKWDI